MSEERIRKAIRSCERALEEINDGNKRLAVGSLDYARDYLLSAVHLLISEIKDEEGKF